MAGPEPVAPEVQGSLNWQGQHGQQNDAPKASQNLRIYCLYLGKGKEGGSGDRLRISWPHDGKIVRDYLAWANIITWVLMGKRRQKRENQRHGSTRGLDPPLPALKRKAGATRAGCRQLPRAETARSWIPF